MEGPSKKIAQIALYKTRATLLRLDVLPFVIAYPFVLFLWVTNLAEDTWVNMWLIAAPVCLACQVLAWLSTVWSVEMKCLVTGWRATELASATHVKVTPTIHNGAKALVPLSHKEGQPATVSFALHTNICTHVDAHTDVNVCTNRSCTE